MTDLLEHYFLLRRTARVAAYERAIRKVVRPGDRVLDVGSGTGILGFLALRAGARHVVAVENTPAIFLAEEIARRNGLADRMTFIFGDAADTRLRERADVIVTDLVRHGGIESGWTRVLRSAASALALPGARKVPRGVRGEVVPISAPAVRASLTEWSPFRGFDFSPLGAALRNRGLHLEGRRRAALGPAVVLPPFDLWRGEEFPVMRRGTARVRRPGTLDGLLWTYRLDLAPGVFLECGTAAGRPPLFFPLAPPVPVRPRDSVSFELVAGADGSWSWRVDVRRGRRRAGSGRFAGALSTPDLAYVARLRDGWTPAPSKEVRREARIVGLMDGGAISDVARRWARDSGLPYARALDEVRRVCIRRHIPGGNHG